MESAPRSKTVDKTLALIAILSILIAWFIGNFNNEINLIPKFKELLPNADEFHSITNDSYSAHQKSSKKLLCYIGIGKANGYGGTLKVAVAIDLDGKVLNISIIEQRETYSFLRRVLKRNLIESLLKKSYKDDFVFGDGIDNVTGATVTATAIVKAVKRANYKISSEELSFPVKKEQPVRIKFGVPEIVLFLLYLLGFIARKKWFKYTNIFRWVSMLTGLIFLGFIFNNPLTIICINKILLGYLPEWQNHIYWYLLIFGIIFFYIINNRNIYCEWICPFGAAQECLGLIGGAKVRTPKHLKNILLWTQRCLAWLAIILALLYRNPGISSYEVFGSFFKLIGSNYQFALLGIVLVASLFLRRPWCSYLCPLRAVTDFIRLIRNWIEEIWQKKNQKQIV